MNVYCSNYFFYLMPKKLFRYYCFWSELSILLPWKPSRGSESKYFGWIRVFLMDSDFSRVSDHRILIRNFKNKKCDFKLDPDMAFYRNRIQIWMRSITDLHLCVGRNDPPPLSLFNQFLEPKFRLREILRAKCIVKKIIHTFV